MLGLYVSLDEGTKIKPSQVNITFCEDFGKKVGFISVQKQKHFWQAIFYSDDVKSLTFPNLRQICGEIFTQIMQPGRYHRCLL